MKTQMTSDINVTHKPTRFPGREVPSWMHEELSKKDATAPTLNPESEREFDDKFLTGAETDQNDSKVCDAFLEPIEVRTVKQFIAKVEQKVITTTLERFEGIIKGLEKKHTDHYRPSSFACYECAKNGVLTEQLQALSTLKQELLKGNDAE